MIPKAFSFVEVANYLGMHPVTVSRIARKLRETGILARVCLLYTSCHTHSIYDNRTSVFRIFISKVLHMSSYACLLYTSQVEIPLFLIAAPDNGSPPAGPYAVLDGIFNHRLQNQPGHLIPVSYTHLDVYKRQFQNRNRKYNFGIRLVAE